MNRRIDWTPNRRRNHLNHGVIRSVSTLLPNLARGESFDVILARGPVGFQRHYRRFDWSRRLRPMARTAADLRGARGGEYPTKHHEFRCKFCPAQLALRKRKRRFKSGERSHRTIRPLPSVREGAPDGLTPAPVHCATLLTTERAAPSGPRAEPQTEHEPRERGPRDPRQVERRRPKTGGFEKTLIDARR